MLAEVMAHFAAQEAAQGNEQSAVQRSLALAAKGKIGPFKRVRRATGATVLGSGRAASSDFIHEAPPPSWRLGSSFDAVCEASDKNALLRHPLPSLEIKEVHYLIPDTARDMPAFRLTLGDVSIYLGCGLPNKDGNRDGHFDLQNADNTFWIENCYGNNMNRRAALFVIDAVEKALGDDATAAAILAQQNESVRSQVSLDGLRARCAQALDILRTLLPEHGPTKFSPRLTDDERQNARYERMHIMGQKMYSDRPFENSPVKVLSAPYFPQSDFGDVSARYGAFRFQRQGVINWVQFTNIDGSPAADFVVAHPRNEYGKNTTSNMGREEALATLRIIDQELPADHPVRQVGVLERLEAHAQTLKSRPYYNLAYIRIIKDSLYPHLQAILGHHLKNPMP